MTASYKVPLSGIYKVRAVLFKSVPTGEFETVSNFRYKWWKFWSSEPKMITREIRIIEETLDATRFVTLKAGESFCEEMIIERVGI